MPAFVPQLSGAQLGAGGSATIAFTEQMGKICVKNSGPGAIAVALGGTPPVAVTRGTDVNVLESHDSVAYYPVNEIQISFLADASGAGVDVLGCPIGSPAPEMI